MTTALAKAKKKLQARPVHFMVMRVAIVGTGEVVGALVPLHPIDRRSMKERRYFVGKELRADLRESRNVGFWRKVHVLGGWLADNVEAFAGLDMHSAIKRLQERSGIGCESVEYDLPGIGKLTRTEARSLNFSDMDEGEFSALWDGGNGDGGWIGWLRREVFGHLSEESRLDVEAIIQKPDGAA